MTTADGILWATALVAGLLTIGTIQLALGARHIPRLPQMPRFPTGGARPSITIIAPARDEARHIESALRSLLAQDYLDFEVIAINDRSTDGTADILARLQREDARLKVLQVSELPDGWLGKNHANAMGAAAARGELLLFTDADVRMTPDTLDRAACCLTQEGWDHITAAPRAILPGPILGLFALYFGLLFSLFARPWAARNPRSRAHVGIGAFNLVRRSAYDAVGGHERLRLRPDDDLKLGKLLKSRGYRQLFVNGTGCVEVEWYSSWGEVRNGLMKNLFAGSGYSIAFTVFGSLLHLLVLAGPPLGLMVATGPAFWLSAWAYALLAVQGWASARELGTARWGGLLLPVFGVFGTYLMWRSMLLALTRGGIEWRGRFYPLDELRRNVV
jgi:cellulose synthase/poly-beta-1,6-N-acetylglucosamine synthase-like glycosyltransferase